MDEPQNQRTCSCSSDHACEHEECACDGESAQLRAQVDEYLAGWKRAQADYVNLQRERERERGEFTKFANAGLLESLLPALDQFALAMRFLPSTDDLSEGEKKKWESWLVGMRAVQSLWEQAASSTGLERIPTTGKFDPTLHEAVGHEPSADMEPDTILRVVQDGWRLHGKVFRPAKVIVASSLTT
jgi:molecular chaperone GrpE